MPFGCREGINIFLAGFIPTENLRFRDFSLSFKVSENAEEGESIKQSTQYDYPDMIKTMQACTARVCLCDHAPAAASVSGLVGISACRMPKTNERVADRSRLYSSRSLPLPLLPEGLCFPRSIRQPATDRPLRSSRLVLLRAPHAAAACVT